MSVQKILFSLMIFAIWIVQQGIIMCFHLNDLVQFVKSLVRLVLEEKKMIASLVKVLCLFMFLSASISVLIAFTVQITPVLTVIKIALCVQSLVIRIALSVCKTFTCINQEKKKQTAYLNVQ